jgi:uncharacterized protein (DUF2062 family)
MNPTKTNKDMKKIVSYITGLYTRLADIHGEPRHIALGYALGVFLAASPLVGLHCILAVLISGALKWNRLAAGFGAFHSNLLTAPVIYSSTYFIGTRILGSDDQLIMPYSLVDLFARGPIVLVSLTVGGFILGIPCAIISYYLSIHIIKRYRSYLTFKDSSNANKS